MQKGPAPVVCPWLPLLVPLSMAPEQGLAATGGLTRGWGLASRGDGHPRGCSLQDLPPAPGASAWSF